MKSTDGHALAWTDREPPAHAVKELDRLLSRHRDVVLLLFVFLGLFGLFAKFDQDCTHGGAGEFRARVVFCNWSTDIRSDINGVHGEDDRGRLFDPSFGGFFTIDED